MSDMHAPLEPPKWLDQPFVQNCLQNFFNNKQLNIINLKIKPATAKGENYASYIYRINVVYSDGERNNINRNSVEKKLNIIVKTSLQGDLAFDILTSCNVYEKEIEFYEVIAPAVRKLLQKANDNDQILAETFSVSKKNNAMLFEDLTLKGYRISSVKRGFDKTETQMILSKIAKLHAAGAVLQEQNPNMFANFKHGMINRLVGSTLSNMFLTHLDAIVEVLQGWPDFAYYAEKIRRFRKNFIEKGCQAFDADPNQFNTFIHGDLWTNNIMLKYDSDDANDDSPVKNVVFLDFQFACWTSPVMDLHYFLNTSLREPLRTHHINELVEYYHKELVTMLKRLNYGKHVPTLSELLSQFREKSFYGFSSSCTLQPILLNEHTEDADFEALLLGDERSVRFKRLMYSNPKVQSNLRNLIPLYDRLGVFD